MELPVSTKTKISFIRLFLIVKNTIHNEYRSKSIFFIIGILVLITLFINAIMQFQFSLDTGNGSLSLSGNTASSVKSGLTIASALKMKPYSLFMSINIFCTYIIALIIGLNIIHNDLKNKIIELFYSFPITLNKYIAGRILGGFILIVASFAFTSIIGAILCHSSESSFAANLLTFACTLFTASIYYLTILLITILFSLYAPKLPAFILILISLAVIGSAGSTFEAFNFHPLTTNFSFIKLFQLIIYLAFPHIDVLNEIVLSLSKSNYYTVPPKAVLELLHYIAALAILYFFIFITLRKRQQSA